LSEIIRKISEKEGNREEAMKIMCLKTPNSMEQIDYLLTRFDKCANFLKPYEPLDAYYSIPPQKGNLDTL
jgi:hypothetical protein